MKKNLFFVILIILIYPLKSSYGYDNEKTHPDLAENAIRKSVLSTTSLLRDMGLINGIEYIANGMKLWDWARLGAEREDAGSDFKALIGKARFKNHFHDPLENWAEAGLSDLQNGMSMVLWAQDSSSQEGALEGDWSWKTVRADFFNALTKATQAERDDYFARTFKGLGHQMHLIQDAGQPDHVRNDAHPLDGKGFKIDIGYERWSKMKRSYIQALASNPVFPQVSLSLSPGEGLVPIARLIDTNLYTGTVPTAGTVQGLAEYANSNFFSDDTIFAAERFSPGENHYYPYPNSMSTNLQDYINDEIVPEQITNLEGIEEYGLWIRKDMDGEVVNHLVRPSFFSKLILNTLGEGGLFYSTFYRDEICHIDYARKLIPRAVGYSAALINYFFRGQIDMVEDPENPGKFIIKNESDEAMSGIFDLYYDDSTGIRKAVEEGGSWELSISAHGSSPPVTFTFPNDGKDPGSYMLVFKGNLGLETGSVIGKQLELKKKIYGRMAIIYQNNRPYFQVITENGTFNGVLPKENFIYSTAMRFDKADPNELVVIGYYDSPSQERTFQFHLFHIGDNEIAYLGKIGERVVPKSNNTEKRLCATPNPYYDYNGYTCTRSLTKEIYSSRHDLFVGDFYLENRILKPIVLMRNYEKTYIAPGCTEHLLYKNEECTDSVINLGDETCGTGILLNGYEEAEIDYNGKILNDKNFFEDGFANVTTSCNITDYKVAKIPEMNNYLIFGALNEKDFVYAMWDKDNHGYSFWNFKSSNNLDLPQKTISNYIPKLKSLIRKNGKYSFFIYDTYKIGLPEVSYSSEIGKVDCSGFLIGENNLGWKITPWSAQIVQFDSCDNYKVIETIPVSLGDDLSKTIFDLVLIEK